MERVNLKLKHGQAKVIGTLITLSGAMVMTLYKGPIVNIFGSHEMSIHSSSTASGGSQHWVAGTVMLLLSVIGGIVALIMERNNMSAWIVGFDSRLFAAVYSGVVCSGIAYNYVQGFVNKIRGPVFVTAFSPLSMIITAILGALVLGELVHLGTLIGATIVVTGLYSVVWGKSKDENLITGEGKALELPEVWEDVSRPGNFVDDVINGHPGKQNFAKKHLHPEEP
ncbi:hypothetical protein POM88_004621 [Heracleum sosnowskyi]|uniref:WAT1-related protein n=1 Tax=Heracleum sosnowskyi TaxID=360622 RepID=A0AAD8NE79_9APIA|nr:hypothetical protein POM88_004621 [Heracleum sosnowskyi]